MNRGAGDAAAVRPFEKTILAVACVVGWVVAAASAGPLGIWLNVGAAAVILGIVVVAVEPASSRRLLRPTPRLVLVGAAGGGLMIACTYLFYPWLGRILPFVAKDTAILYVAFRGPSAAIAAFALGPIIVGEELVWRGVVQTVLVRRFGRSGGVVLAAAVYALAHAPLGSPVLVLVAMACGLGWGALRDATDSLVPALVAHLAWDALVLLWLPLVV